MAATRTAAETKKELGEVIYLPLIPGEEKTLWIARNGQSWSIPRGVQVRVPSMVAEIVRERDAREMAARAFAEEEAAKANQAVAPSGQIISL